MSAPATKSRRVTVSGVVARWALGALFVYMGLVKALDPVDFLKLLRQYDLTQHPWLLNSVAAALPWFEVFCGLLLIAGIAVRGTSLLIVGMLIPFTAVVFRRALAIHSAQAIAFCAIKFDCGCGNGEEFICRKLAQNVMLILFAIWLVTGRGRKWALRYELGGGGCSNEGAGRGANSENIELPTSNTEHRN